MSGKNAKCMIISVKGSLLFIRYILFSFYINYILSYHTSGRWQANGLWKTLTQVDNYHKDEAEFVLVILSTSRAEYYLKVKCDNIAYRCDDDLHRQCAAHVHENSSEFSKTAHSGMSFLFSKMSTNARQIHVLATALAWTKLTASSASARQGLLEPFVKLVNKLTFYY